MLSVPVTGRKKKASHPKEKLVKEKAA